ncbi:MAG: HAD family hydrolase [Coriobacteriales bacterium]|nr:HAD family hydrolase [Coriobacteriales bacterium]
MSTKVPLAVFDLDGTLVDGQSGALISTYLLSRNVVNPIAATRLAWWGVRYKLHLPQRQEEPREVILTALNRKLPDDIRQTMRDFHDEVIVPRYRPEAIPEVHQRKQEGCVTLLASATFHEVAERASEYLGMDGFVATEMEQDEEGVYTGLVEGPVTEGREKLNAVVKWADEHLGRANWYIAYAYGDHVSDMSLLATARHAFAVNPSYLMKLAARHRKWTILKWRTSS